MSFPLSLCNNISRVAFCFPCPFPHVIPICHWLVVGISGFGTITKRGSFSSLTDCTLHLGRITTGRAPRCWSHRICKQRSFQPWQHKIERRVDIPNGPVIVVVVEAQPIVPRAQGRQQPQCLRHLSHCHWSRPFRYLRLLVQLQLFFSLRPWRHGEQGRRTAVARTTRSSTATAAAEGTISPEHSTLLFGPVDHL